MQIEKMDQKSEAIFEKCKAEFVCGCHLTWDFDMPFNVSYIFLTITLVSKYILWVKLKKIFLLK